MAKKNPFADLDDETVGPEPEGKDPVVSLSEPDEDEDSIDTAGAGAEPKDGPSRDEKRKARNWMNKQEREAKDQRIRDLEAQAERDRALALQASTYAQQMGQYSQQGRPPQKDPIDDAAELLNREAKVLRAEYNKWYENAGKLDRAQAFKESEDFERRAMEIQTKETDLGVQRALRNAGVTRQDPQATQREVFISNLRQKHPEATANPNVMAFANGVQLQLAAERNVNIWDPKVVEDSMTAAEKKFRLGSFKNGEPRGSDPGLRARLAGPPRGGGSGNDRDTGSRTVVMDKASRQMANAAFPEIKDEKLRFRKWAQMTRKESAEEAD